MSNTETAKQAIFRSVSHCEIVTISADSAEEAEALCEELLVVADDSVECDRDEATVTEFWGTTDGGDDWRVHVALPGGVS